MHNPQFRRQSEAQESRLPLCRFCWSSVTEVLAIVSSSGLVRAFEQLLAAVM